MQLLARQNHLTSKVLLNLGVEDQLGRSRGGGDLCNVTPKAKRHWVINIERGGESAG
jgi:hypothetical protein